MCSFPHVYWDCCLKRYILDSSYESLHRYALIINHFENVGNTTLVTEVCSFSITGRAESLLRSYGKNSDKAVGTSATITTILCYSSIYLLFSNNYISYASLRITVHRLKPLLFEILL
jgi:hypothetical protein